jgi:hypothetical protein
LNASRYFEPDPREAQTEVEMEMEFEKPALMFWTAIGMLAAIPLVEIVWLMVN